MALTLDQLAAEMRLDTPVEEPTAGILTRLMGVGSALVDLHGSEAPDAVQDEAVIRLCAYLYDQPESPSGTRYATAWRNSGAASLVGPWVNRSAAVLTPFDGDSATATDPIARSAAREALEVAEGKADAETVRLAIADLQARLMALEQA